MAQPTPPEMLLQATIEFAQPVNLNLARCCPTMDLVAVVTSDEQLDVYRFNGQRAFGLQRRNPESKVSSVCWKYNGTYLALGWSDGAVEVISTETGNVLQQFRQVTSSASQNDSEDTSISRGIDCIGWGLNLSRDRASKLKDSAMLNAGNNRQAHTTDGWDRDTQELSVDELLDKIASIQKASVPDELPDVLARIDVVSLFPRLPLLPLLPAAVYRFGKHPSAELFSNHQSLDAALHGSTENSYNDLDILLLSGQGGTTRLVLYDSLNIGNVEISSEWRLNKVKFLQHASHPYSYTHMFLAELGSGHGNSPDSRLALIPLSLHFMETRGNYLQIISSKTAQLELLLQYMSECLFAMQYHFNHAIELPKRFMNLIKETLEEKNEATTLVQLLYHLAATGDCPPVLKEWLVDEVAERGHKRWDQSIGAGLIRVLQLTHENFLPALDRCSAIVSRIAGLAEYHKTESNFGIDPSSVALIHEVVRCLRLLGHQVLIYGYEEHRQFHQFSKWLRHEIDVQATDPNSATADETLEKDVGIDYGLLLPYIEGPLEHSPLEIFLGKQTDSDYPVLENSQYGRVKEAIEAFKENQEAKAELLSLKARFNDLNLHCQKLVDKTTQWQRKSSAISCGFVLEENQIKIWDMRMVAENCISTYVALVSDSKPSEVRLHGIDHTDPFDNTTAAVKSKRGIILRFETGQIADLKFVDDERIMFLLKLTDGSSKLLSVPYRFSISTSGQESLQPYEDFSSNISRIMLPGGSADTITRVIVFDEEKMWSYVKHTFEATDTFKPANIEINGRKKRRVCAVLSAGGRLMRICDLDFKAESEEGWNTSMLGPIIPKRIEQ